MASPEILDSEGGRIYTPYRSPRSDFEDASNIRRKPVPMWSPDIRPSPSLSPNPSQPSSPPATRYVSYKTQYAPAEPSPTVQMIGLGLRPGPLTEDSFTSTKSGNSNFSSDTYTSDTRLLSSFSGSNTPKLPPPSPPYEQTPPHVSRFGWWNPVWMMYIMFLLGVIGALSHHFFYNALAGQEAHDQLKMLRYGAALAYFTKAMLVASLILAFRQQIWATFRRKLLSIDAVDSLFAVTEDLSAVVNAEVLKKAKVAMFLASIIWLAPLVVILTPASLTVEPSMQTNRTMCSSVRTLNFTPEAAKDWRVPLKIDGLNEISLSFWNITSDTPSDPNLFDYYDQPSYPMQQVATLAAYLQKTVVRTDAANDICGVGWNCSYVVSFTAPGYKCTEQKAGFPRNSTIGTSPFSISQLIPDGSSNYIAHAYLGDYRQSQIPSGDKGIPERFPPFPDTLGVFRTEPILWIGQAELRDPNATIPNNRSDPNWKTAFDQKLFACEHYVTNYTVLFNYTSGSQATKVLNRSFLTPVVNTTYIPNANANDGTNDNTTAFPRENYIHPRDISNYRITAAYHSMGAMLRKFINGTIELQGTAFITKTEATKTRLIDPHNYFALPSLPDQIQSFYEDIILSLFSNPQFIEVAWASNPALLSGTRRDQPEGQYPCTKQRMLNIFIYHTRDLWLVYGATILLALIGIAFGSAAVSQNGWKLRNTRFSSIVAATRGPGLDQLRWRRTSVWGEVPMEIGDVKVGYGIINRGGEEVGEWSENYGFGLDGEVRQGWGHQRTKGGVLSFRRWHYDYK